MTHTEDAREFTTAARLAARVARLTDEELCSQFDDLDAEPADALMPHDRAMILALYNEACRRGLTLYDLVSE
jgi:hypothetical protein